MQVPDGFRPVGSKFEIVWLYCSAKRVHNVLGHSPPPLPWEMLTNCSALTLPFSLNPKDSVAADMLQDKALLSAFFTVFTAAIVVSVFTIYFERFTVALPNLSLDKDFCRWQSVLASSSQQKSYGWQLYLPRSPLAYILLEQWSKNWTTHWNSCSFFGRPSICLVASYSPKIHNFVYM